MLNAAKKENDYCCFLSENTELPMMFIDDAIESAIKLMSVNRADLSISGSYNVTGFSITPNQLISEIQSNGFKISVNFKPDFRQQIADSWPKKIDDSVSRNDWGWKPKFRLKESIEIALK